MVYEQTKIIFFRALVINNIILDVEKYPEFMPWCQEAKIIHKDADGMIADLVIKFKGFTESYRSCIYQEHYRDEYSGQEQYNIKIEAINGPLQYLHNLWTIKELKNASEVKFSIDFEFKSRILGMLSKIVFPIAVEKVIGAFISRAETWNGSLE